MHVHDTAPECWRPVPYEPYSAAYAVSCLGRVKRTAPHKRHWALRALKHQRGRSGYPSVTLSMAEHGPRSYEVHRMAALAFLPNATDGQTDVRHLDGDRWNCEIENLAWGTHRENGEDMVRHGRSTQGVRNPAARLNDAIVSSMLVDAARGDPVGVIAKRYGIRHQHASRIVNRKAWRHVT